MRREDIIQRASYNGLMAAQMDFYRDFATAKTYTDNTILLERSYPDYKSEIREAHKFAYDAFRKSHKRG